MSEPYRYMRDMCPVSGLNNRRYAISRTLSKKFTQRWLRRAQPNYWAIFTQLLGNFYPILGRPFHPTALVPSL